MQHLTHSVADIVGRPGQYRDLSIWAPLPGVGNALARLGRNPAEASLRLESVVEGILATGYVRSDGVFECARCLDEVEGRVSAEICELFVTAEHVAAREDAYPLSGVELDLEPMLRDALALALPLRPLCRADCPGLCAQCGRRLDGSACDCAQEDMDPRWAALSALRDRLDD